MNHNASGALYHTWTSFILIDVLEDEEAVICCENIKVAELYKEVYLNHFNAKQWFKNAKLKDGKQEWNYKAMEKHVVQAKGFLNYLKTDKKPNDKFAYSIAKCDVSTQGVDDDMYEMMQDLLKDQTDLGNSRHFKSAEELDDKFTMLLNCKAFIGTETSWSLLSKNLHIPCMSLHQFWPYKSIKRIRIDGVRTYVDPHIHMVTEK